MIDIKEILVLRGLDTTKRIKLVRHLETRRFNLYEFHKTGLLELYQSYQSKPVFDQCDYIVSFIGMENSKARLVGVYEVTGVQPAQSAPLPLNIASQYPEMFPPNGYFYVLKRLSGFEDLIERVVIDWGKSALAWHQWLSSKEIVEILPTGYIKPFPGYLDFVLSFDELSTIINYPNANREWHIMLRAVAGIYLVVDTSTGNNILALLPVNKVF